MDHCMRPEFKGGVVECEPKNWPLDDYGFFRFNEHGGYVWCAFHFCWHWVDAPRASNPDSKDGQNG